MKPIKLVLLGILGLCLIYAFSQIGPRYIPALRTVNLTKIPGAAMIQPVINSALAAAGNNLPGVAEKTKVLGAQTSTALQSLPNPGYEKIRYDYCKEVVRVYEKNN